MRRVIIAFLAVLAGAVARPEAGGAATVSFPPMIPNAEYPYVQGFSGCVGDPLTTLPGMVSWIWSTGNGGSRGCTGAQSPIPGASSTGLWPIIKNNKGFNINGHNLAFCNLVSAEANYDCFLAQHPDWVPYQCDAMTPAGNGNLAVDLVFASPVVQSFVEGFLAQYQNAGFNGFAIDNVNPENVDQECGWYVGAQSVGTTVTAVANNGGKVQVTLASADGYQAGNPIYISGLTGALAYVNGAYGAGTTISSDNVTLPLTYDSGGSGLSAAAQYAAGTAPAFGGTWYQPYSGAYGSLVVDPVYSQAFVNWACAITSFANALGVYTVGNVSTVGFTYDNGTSNQQLWSYQQQAAGCFNIDGTESVLWTFKQGYPGNRNNGANILYDNAFNIAFGMLRSIAKNQSLWMMTYTPCSVTVRCSAYGPGTDTDEIYATALWLLFKSNPVVGEPPSYWSPIGFLNDGTGTSFGTCWTPSNVNGTDHACYAPPSSTWTPDLGDPIGDPFSIGTTCYERKYGKGIVVVNASSTNSCIYMTSAGHDQFGNKVKAGHHNLMPIDSKNLIAYAAVIKTQ